MKVITIPIIFGIILFFNSCSSLWNNRSCDNVKVENINNDSLIKHIGEKITLKGKAVNAKLGAFLLLENGTVIWMDEIESWPDGYYSAEGHSKTLEVTGTLIEKYDLPVFIDSDSLLLKPQGIPVPEGTDLNKASYRLLLRDASWIIIKK